MTVAQIFSNIRSGFKTPSPADDVVAGFARGIINPDGSNYLAVNAAGQWTNSDGGNLPQVLTSATTLTAAQSGATFFVNNATGFIITLPLPALGLMYEFICTLAVTITDSTKIVTNGSANIIKGGNNSVAGDAGSNALTADTVSFVISASTAGDKVKLFSDGTSWFGYGISRIATGVTFTQAS